MDDATQIEIVDQLNEIIIDLAPDATLRSMYGGTVIELKKGDPKSRVGGIYVYANYVSLELSQGVFFDDSKQLLEGNGKLRRHVKIHELKDVKEKSCDDFLRQAILQT
jgi:hypothetical protein